MRRAFDLLLALASAALLIPSVALYRADLAGRKPALDFVAKFNIETRRPDVAHTVGYAPTPDWAAEMIADAALRDAYEPVNLTDATPAFREAWINAAGHVDEELVFAKGALLDAVAVRPGWPFYQSLLGQTVFALESRAYSPDLVQKPATWSQPLLNAAHGAPGASSPWRSLAAAYLQTWPLLEKTHTATAGEVFTHAFADPDFVRIVFPDAARLLGTDRAIRFVPDAPQSLTAAFDYFAKANDVGHAWPLRQRWERAEWNARVSDLADIERHAKRGDVDDVRNLCDAWTSRHSVWDYDTPAAHQQAARILEVWPGGRRGAWSNDPLAEVARYLITRNGDSDRFAAVVARQIDSFAGVSNPTLAEVKLLSGDVNGAERIAQTAEDAGTLAWAPYMLTLARIQGKGGDAMSRLPVAARQTHEALLIGGDPVIDDADGARCGAKTEMAVHGAAKEKTITVRLTTSSPALVDVGINRARAATLLVDGARDVTFILEGPRDKTVWTRTLCGAADGCAAVTSRTATR